MRKYRSLAVCLLLVLVLLAPTIADAALPPLASGTFASGTFLVPMDSKQADRVHVYGLIHEFLRSSSTASLARVIEPPDVTMQTALTPSGALYQGGPFLIDARFAPQVSALLATPIFSGVTVTKLTAPFTSDRMFFVSQPTKILVIMGVFGRTDLTLTRMGINFTMVDPDVVLNNPSIINQYTLIVVDCPGWYGNPASYSPDRRAKIQTVYSTISTHVQSGNEVIFTDIALLDMNATFPGYVNIAPGAAGSWDSTVYNPPKGGFQPEFPSQYFNSGTNPNSIKVFTQGGGRVVSSILPAHQSDVRIIVDSDKFGVPFHHAILGFYFPFGNGIVEGLAWHPYEQLYPTYADQNGYYATYEIYGNKFVHGPQNDFLLKPTPPSVTVSQGQTATYRIDITSIGSFNSPVSLQVTGTPSYSTGTFSLPLLTPPPGGTVSSTLTVTTSTSPGTPPGTYNLTVTGASTLPLLTHYAQVQLIVTVPTKDFTLNAIPKAPTPLIVQQGKCGNYSVSVKSIGNFSAPVNLTLSNIPTKVTHIFIPNPITPAAGGNVSSALQVCPATDAVPGNYTMTIMGTGGGITHTVDVVLGIPAPIVPPVNPLIYLLVLLLLLLGLGLALLALYLSRKRGLFGPRRPRFQYVLPLPTIRCRNCGRLIPLHAVYCPYCGRPQVVMARKPKMRAVMMIPRISGRSIIAFSLSLISGILVLLNSAALLSPTFYGPWSSIFWWLPILGPSKAFALGFVIALTLIMGSIIMVLTSGVLADIIIFPFAVFSLIVGGGFIAGMILAIIGGILGALKRQR